MFFYGGLVLICLIILIYQNNKLQKENIRLKNEISKLKNNDKEEFNSEILDNMQVVEDKKENEINNIINFEVQEEKSKMESRNTSILITGAILIVLAAIVFLKSTWNVVPNIVKSIVLILLVGVFLQASKLAQNKFKLNKVGATFFYIAMAYIPICLISISAFGLLGDYLSISGVGKYIYLTISGLITGIIYYINYKRNNSKILFYGSILSRILINNFI